MSRRGAEGPGPLERLHAILGAPGLMIGVFSLLSFGFGLVVLVWEYNRLRRVGAEALGPAVRGWVRTAPVHEYLGLTLPDYIERWRRAPPADRDRRLAAVQRALEALGDPARVSPAVEIVALTVAPRGGAPVAWWPPRPLLDDPADLAETVALPANGHGTPIEVVAVYRPSREVARALGRLQTSYRRLLLAVLGLSGYSLLCLGYMILHARALRDRVARESAQAATLDLADRTCHELGNVAFVLANERRNLAEHLALVERFVAEEPDAVARAARRVGLEPAQAERFRAALVREYADRGIEPAVELRDGAAVAADVCKQIAVCSQYIALTVRELDAYLKQSSLPVAPEPLALEDGVDDALALLGPGLKARGAVVERRAEGPGRSRALADRRLLVHALVNLLKNALEAAAAAGIAPRLTLTTRRDGATAWIEVADNGPGIPPEVLPRIFEIGFSTKGPGRGRGLAIVQESIHAQRGRLEVDSQPGAGTTFRIALPAAPDEAAEAAGA